MTELVSYLSITTGKGTCPRRCTAPTRPSVSIWAVVAASSRPPPSITSCAEGTDRRTWGDTLKRKVPPDPEDRRGRATWSFALLVCNGFGQHRCVQAELNLSGAEGSRSCGCLAVGRQDEVGSPKRTAGSLIEPECHPEGPIPLGLATPGFAEPFTQHFGGGLTATDGPKDEGLPQP
jgi:hypothetical protein